MKNGKVLLPPHPATVAQAKPDLPGRTAKVDLPPHPATVVQARSAFPALRAPGAGQPVTSDWRRPAIAQRMEQAQPTPYQRLVASGRQKYLEGAGELGGEEATRRQRIFETEYETDPHKGTASINSSLITTEDVQGNEYNNWFLEDGTFVAASNHHAVLKKEKDLPPQQRTFKPPLSLSEVIFRQIVIKTQQGLKWNKILKRSNVVNDETKVVFDAIGWQSGNTYTSKHDEFFALLSTPNGIAAIFLLRDHGKELGISRITSIRLKGGDGKNMLIEFA